MGKFINFVLKAYHLTFKMLSLWEPLGIVVTTVLTVTLSTPTKDTGIGNKDSALTTPCDNQVSSETELTDPISFVQNNTFS